MRMTVKQLNELVKKAENRLRNDDPVFAAEKLYKAAEESIKILAIKNEIAEEDETKWNTYKLNECAKALAAFYGKNLKDNWDIALHQLHMEGFHENNLKPEDILVCIHNITDLIEIVEDNA